MSRGLLGEDTLKELSKELPDLRELHILVLTLSPDFISMKMPPESEIPIAAVCLQDSVSVLVDASHAFHEILAHRSWYLEKRETPLERTAIHFTRYYADDLALRLYSASEHLANAIIYMLEISEQALSRYKKNRVSKQSVVGHFLIKEKPNHPVTREICKLVDSEDWCKTKDYRDDWVHNKPPIIEGTGIAYERRTRWEVTDTHRGISFGGGDRPKYSADELLEFTKAALFLFTEVLKAVTKFYVELLGQWGITINQDGGLQVTL